MVLGCPKSARAAPWRCYREARRPPGALGKLTSFLKTSLLFLASSLDVSASAVLGFLEDWNGEGKKGR